MNIRTNLIYPLTDRLKILKIFQKSFNFLEVDEKKGNNCDISPVTGKS